MPVEKQNEKEKYEKGDIINMYVPLPFPNCSQCNKKNNESYHKKCGGSLEIDPSTNVVRCTKCGKYWDIWATNYNCSCGHTFKAAEVKNSVEDMLELCRLCAEELDLIQSAYWKRKKLAYESKRDYIYSFLRGLGYAAGVYFEKLVEYLLQMFDIIKS